MNVLPCLLHGPVAESLWIVNPWWACTAPNSFTKYDQVTLQRRCSHLSKWLLLSYFSDSVWYYPAINLQDLLELTPQKDALFFIGDWNGKVGSQDTTGVTGKFGLGVRNEAGQRLIEFCQENALVMANTLFQQHKRRPVLTSGDVTRW